MVVTKPDSVKIGIPNPANPDAPKLPNSELIFQLLRHLASEMIICDIRSGI